MVEGIKWRVGNGRDIRIWGTTWIAGSSSGRVLTANQEQQGLMVVADLMIEDPQRRWNEQLIKATFVDSEAQAIMNTPLSWSGLRDKLMWRWCPNGFFTVKSFYKQLQLESLTSEPGTSVSYPWKKIWKLQVSNKVIYFMYRAVNNTLPCKRNLVRRGVMLHDGCVSCDAMLPESLDHIFLHYEWVQRVWFAAFNLRSSAIPSFRLWISEMLLGENTDLVQQIVMLIWAIWKRRNDLTFKDKGVEITDLISMANTFLADWLTVANTGQQGHGNHQDSRPCDREEGWKRPEDGMLKMNVDEGWSGVAGQGLGMVIRDHHGECMFAATNFLRTRLDPLVAEATAIRWAMGEALKLDINSIVLETDSMEFYSCFWNKKQNLLLDTLLLDCTNMASQFSSFNLVHVKREGNKVAHLLASLAVDFPNKCWWDNFPSAVNSALLADVFSVVAY
ncbi:uncharacterized protein LOC130727336 [Lotus japonicus]|uniref:uncharacterized protein LOC130727336 n=1 Tax=Lotus japonicus TaxID=34305 RepID=UPI00258D701E|nr:uncharacterized protein LOC130727336 [Lotus japonicus]